MRCLRNESFLGGRSKAAAESRALDAKREYLQSSARVLTPMQIQAGGCPQKLMKNVYNEELCLETQNISHANKLIFQSCCFKSLYVFILF